MADKSAALTKHAPRGADYCNTPGTSCFYKEDDVCYNCGRKKGWRKMQARYEVTGLFANSTRHFKPVITTSLRHASMINLWRGTVWRRNPDGTRTKLWSVWN